MTKRNAIANYRKFTASSEYMLGFIYKHQLYMIRVEELMPRWLVMKPASKNHPEKLQMNLKAKHKRELINKGATIVCSEEEFLSQNTIHNKGFTFERMVFEMNGQGEQWARNNIGFEKQGDINIDGKEIQIKFQNAQVVATKTLQRLQRTL